MAYKPLKYNNYTLFEKKKTISYVTLNRVKSSPIFSNVATKTMRDWR